MTGDSITGALRLANVAFNHNANETIADKMVETFDGLEVAKS